MLFQFRDILEQEFEELRNELIIAYDKKGMRTTGRFERELEVEVSDFTAILRGEKYTEQLEYGRRPGNVSKEGVENIKEWILAKNVFSAAIEEIGLSSLAFLISRKIAREGFDREKYGGVDLVSEVVTPERIQKIMDKVSRAAIVNFVSELKLKEWH